MTGFWSRFCRLLLAIAFIMMAGRSFALDIEEVTSPGGITAWLVSDADAPVISLSIIFKGGSALEPSGQEGLAKALTWLMNEGAGDLDSKDFQARLNRRDIEFRFDSDLDTISAELRFFPEDREETFHLLGLALSAPRFDLEPITRMRREFQQHLRADASDPGALAAQAMNCLLFGSDAYARPHDGTKASIEAISRESLEALRRTIFTRDRLIVSVVGNIKAEDLAPLLDRAFGDLAAEGPSFKLPAITLPPKGDVVVIDSDLTQSQILFAGPGITRYDPDYFAAVLVNYILGGGGFSSRLTVEAREKRGLTYGIGTWLWQSDRADLWRGGVATPNDQASAMMDIIRGEWRRMAETGPSADELEKAKAYMIGAYPLGLTSTLAVARTLSSIRYNGFDRDYIERRREAIAAVTLADARRVAKRLLDPDRLTFVLVGKPVGVAPTRPAPKE